MLENLEPRFLMSVSVLFSGGVLSIVGDRANDTVVLTDDGAGSVVVACPSDPAHAKPVAFQGVSAISVSTGDGNDRVDYAVDSSSAPTGVAFSPASLNVATGNGNDQVLISLLLPAVQSARQAACRLSVDLGGGNNACRVTAQGTAPTQAGDSPALVDLSLVGGSGSDSITASFFDVFTELSCDTGAGNDSLFLKFEEGDPDRPMTAGVTLDTGDGNDTVQIDASSSGLTFRPTRIELKFDAGGGNDTATMSFFDVFTDLSIDGGAGNDRVSLKHWGSVGDIAASVDMGDGSDSFQMDASSMIRESPTKASLRLDGGNGNNSVTMSFFDVFTDLTVDGGAGNDRIFMKYEGLLGDSSSLACDLGDGTNSLQVTATGDASSVPGAAPDRLDTTVTGGAGADSVSLSFFDVFTDVSLDTGAGNDSIFLKFEQGDSQRPLATVAVDTGDGNDNFSVMVRESPTKASLGRGIALQYDGGAGNNTATMSFFDVFTDLTVDGGAGNDRVFLKFVDTAGDNSVSADLGDGNNVLQVDATGATDTAQPGVVFETMEMKFASGVGKDAVTASFSDLFTDVGIDTGAGNDAIYLKYELPNGRQSSLAVDAGAGNDTFQASVIPPLEGSSKDSGGLFIKFDGSDGNDTATMSFFDVFTELSLDGGAGNDAFHIKYSDLPGDSTAPISVDLGDGNNTFDLMASDAPPAGQVAQDRATIALTLTGGSGRDVVHASFSDVFAQVSASLGAGDDSMDIRLSSANALAGGGGGGGALAQNVVSVDGGLGNDRITVVVGAQAGASGAVAAVGSVFANLDGGDGNNVIRCAVHGDVALGQAIAATIACGTGNDSVETVCQSSTCDGSVSFAVDTGAGADVVRAVAIGDVNGDGRMDLAVTLGSGNDRCTVEQQGALAGAVSLHIDGSDGADSLSARCALAKDSTGDLDVLLQGGTENDTLSLLIPGGLADSPLLHSSLVADGGDGTDTATITQGVTPISIENLQIAP